MIVVTTETIHGRDIIETLGLVRGNMIRARNVGRDIVAGLKTLVGGEIHEYAELMGEAREQALDRMVEEARGLGADAIFNVRFSASVIIGGAAEMLAYSTAVKIS